MSYRQSSSKEQAPVRDLVTGAGSRNLRLVFCGTLYIQSIGNILPQCSVPQKRQTNQLVLLLHNNGTGSKCNLEAAVVKGLSVNDRS